MSFREDKKKLFSFDVDRPTMEELEPMLKEVSDWELAVLWRKSEWPTLVDKPIYKKPGLWQEVDSEQYNRCVSAAKNFIQAYERLTND